MQSQKSLHKKTITTIEQEDSKGCLSAFMRSQNNQPLLHPKNNNLNNHNHPHFLQNFKSKMALQKHQINHTYQIIQQVLIDENQNLKMQVKFLASEARKSLKRQKLLKEDMKRLNQLYENSLEKLYHVTQQNCQIRKFVQDKIEFLSSTVQLTSIAHIVLQIKYFIRDFCQFFRIAVENNINAVQNLPVNIGSDSQHNKVKIEELNDRFEALMYEYKTSHQPQLRKKCIQIVKQIKQIKRQTFNSSAEPIFDSRNNSQKQSKAKPNIPKSPHAPTAQQESLLLMHNLQKGAQEQFSNYEQCYPEARTPPRKTSKNLKNSSCVVRKGSSDKKY